MGMKCTTACIQGCQSPVPPTPLRSSLLSSSTNRMPQLCKTVNAPIPFLDECSLQVPFNQGFKIFDREFLGRHCAGPANVRLG
jgi:hypothetical protein